MFDEFYYGVCYYPEHWSPDRHASDIRRIKECGFNFVRMGEGAWGYWEPEEGKYQFELFDHVIDLCREHGIKVILGTPTYCAPAWVSHRYPEVLRWDFRRMPMAHGSRRNFNYTSPKYRELSDRICKALAEHYAREPQVIGWQLDNEFNCHMDVSYAPSDTIAFRAWLQDKYKTLDRLNAAWGTAFWSQQYDAWDQIDLPHPTPTFANPTQLLDETRFISDCVVRFARRQAEILHEHNKRWQITHNGLFGNVNGPALAAELDFFSHDQYPLFYSDWWEPAANLVQARSLSFPYAILEQQSGAGGQMTYLQRTPRPGEMRLWAWQSIAHGAKLFSFFRWRTCPYGSEQHWHGLLDQDDRDNRRIAEAKEVAQELKKLPKDFHDAPPARAVAVLREFDNEANDRRVNTYTKDGQHEQWSWLAECARRHVPADFVWPESDWKGYRLLIAPHLRLMTKKLAMRLKGFVESGGVLVLGAQSGLNDENVHVIEKPLPGLLRQLAGIEVEEWTTLPNKATRDALLADGTMLTFSAFVERLRPRGATPIVHWKGDDALLLDGPAVTVNRIGKGAVFYIGGYCAPESVGRLLPVLLKEAGVGPVASAGPEVEIIERVAGRRRYMVCLNHSGSSQRVSGIDASRDLLSDEKIRDEQIVLPPHGVRIVERSLNAPSDIGR